MVWHRSELGPRVAMVLRTLFTPPCEFLHLRRKLSKIEEYVATWYPCFQAQDVRRTEPSPRRFGVQAFEAMVPLTGAGLGHKTYWKIAKGIGMGLWTRLKLSAPGLLSYFFVWNGWFRGNREYYLGPSLISYRAFTGGFRCPASGEGKWVCVVNVFFF